MAIWVESDSKEASGLKENQNYISGKLSKSIVFLQIFIEILLEYAGDSLL